MAEVEEAYRPTWNWALIKMRSNVKPEYFEGKDLSISVQDDKSLVLSTFDGSLWSHVMGDAYEWFKVFRGQKTSADDDTAKVENPKQERMTDYKRSKRSRN